MSKKLNENNIGDLLVAGGVRTLLSGLGGVGAYSVAPSSFNPMMKAAYAGAGGALGHRLSNLALNKMGKNVYIDPRRRKYVPGPGGRLKKKKTLKETRGGGSGPLLPFNTQRAARGMKTYNPIQDTMGPYSGSRIADQRSALQGPGSNPFVKLGIGAKKIGHNDKAITIAAAGGLGGVLAGDAISKRPGKYEGSLSKAERSTMKESAGGLAALSALGGLGAAGGRRIFDKLATPYKLDDDYSFIAGPLGDRYSKIGFDAAAKAPAGSDYSAISQKATMGAYARDRALATGVGAVALPALTYAGYKLLRNRMKKKKR